QRRHGGEHRPRVVHVPRGGAVARRPQARRPPPGDAGGVRVRRDLRRRGGRDEHPQELSRLPVQARRRRRPARRRRARALRLHRVVRALRRGRRRQRVQRARTALRESRERDDGHPHGRRADQRRGSRRNGRRHPRARRGCARGVMEERRLGPVVGLGTWNTFDGDATLGRSVVSAALDAGVRVFDTAPMYGGAEAALGGALRGRRDDSVVATKIWSHSVANGREQYRRQREWFGRVEIEQIHNLANWRGQLEWLEEEREAGRIDRLGVTHYSRGAFDELAEALLTGRFDVVQLPYNPHEREVERRLLPLAAFGVETWAQALVKWVLSDARVDLAIPATSKPERTAENAAAGSPPWFGDEERALVERLAA